MRHGGQLLALVFREQLRAGRWVPWRHRKCQSDASMLHAAWQCPLSMKEWTMRYRDQEQQTAIVAPCAGEMMESSRAVRWQMNLFLWNKYE